jgi:cytochrome c peroxidase
VGAPVRIDVLQEAPRFRQALGQAATLTLRVHGDARGLAADGGVIAGTPVSAGIVRVVVDARNGAGQTVSDTMRVVAFVPGLPTPVLPATPHRYAEFSVPIPAHLRVVPGFPPDFRRPELDSAAANPVTDAGAALGRVLFHDPRLSVNDSVSCASCHLQAFGFSDTARVSVGVFGQRGTRHSMPIGGLRFTTGNGFFWDGRTATLEELALQPIENPVEMGARVGDVVAKIAATSFYGSLFQEAFGSRTITRARIARALAQYMRALVPSASPFDAAFANGALVPDPNRLTAQARDGHALFLSKGCAGCHFSSFQMMDLPANNGLDPVAADTGQGRGRFRAPPLRNVAVRAPYMHDGRFRTLAEVIRFYDSGVATTNDLDGRMRENVTGLPRRLGLTAEQRAALVAFLESLTDSTFLTAEKFSDPFRRPR